MIRSFLHHRSYSVWNTMDEDDRIVNDRLILILSTAKRSCRFEVGSETASFEINCKIIDSSSFPFSDFLNLRGFLPILLPPPKCLLTYRSIHCLIPTLWCSSSHWVKSVEKKANPMKKEFCRHKRDSHITSVPLGGDNPSLFILTMAVELPPGQRRKMGEQSRKWDQEGPSSISCRRFMTKLFNCLCL